MVNEQMLKGNWNQIKGKIRNRWGQLTSDDLQAAQGNFEQLVGLIQRKTGETRSAIEDYFEQLTSDEGSSMSQMAETARQYGQQAMEQVQERSRQTADRFRHGFDQASESFRQRYEDAEQMIQERPAESLAVSFGIGVLAGVLLGISLRGR
jgi:uncharacterized protein YjbJ (UPF0337 family)